MSRITAFFPLLLLGACARQPPVQADGPGFLLGLWHGLTALPALVASLFLDIRMYAAPNTGFGYDLGFVVGFVFSLILVMLSVMARIGGLLTRSR